MTPADNTPVQADALVEVTEADHERTLAYLTDIARTCGSDKPVTAVRSDHPALLHFARHRLTSQPSTDAEPFAYYVEHTGAEPGFIRPPCYVPSGPNYRVTPVYAAHSPADKARIAALESAFSKLLEWWPAGSEMSHAASRMGNGFADDLCAARAALENRDAD